VASCIIELSFLMRNGMLFTWVPCKYSFTSILLYYSPFPLSCDIRPVFSDLERFESTSSPGPSLLHHDRTFLG